MAADGPDPLRFQIPANLIPRLVVPDTRSRQLGRRAHSPFLKGPVPMLWLATASRLPGRALHLGLLVWFRCGLERTFTVRVPSALLASFGLDRDAKARALRELEGAGLVTVHRCRGRPADITLVPVPTPENPDQHIIENAGEQS